MARLERAVLLLLCIFAVKFVFSTAAHFAAPLQGVDMLGSGRNPVDAWLLLLSCTAVLGTFCLYRRAARAIGAKCTKADAVILAVCIAASAAFYLHAMVGRQSLYLWDNATYYNLQVRLESNFADGVFTGVGSTIYKTWFNDYAPLVINLLAEPFFMLTPRTANTFALLCALLIPSLVYYSAWLLLTVLRRKLQPKAPVLFTALSMAFVLLLPLLHIALYRGMPDLLGVAFAFMKNDAGAAGRRVRFQPASPRAACVAGGLYGYAHADPPQLHVYCCGVLFAVWRLGVGPRCTRPAGTDRPALRQVCRGLAGLRRRTAAADVLAHRQGRLQ